MKRVILAALLLFIGACGYKGPLTLPAKPPGATSPPSADSPLPPHGETSERKKP